MSLTDTRYTHWMYVSFIFSILLLLRGILAELTLTASSDSIAENNTLELTCTFTGIETVQAFQMSTGDTLKGSLLSDCSVFFMPPDAALYEYNCPTKKELKWIIKKVTRASDTWTCRVAIPGGWKTATYTISVNVPVKSVTMTSPTGSMVTVREYTETQFVCITSGGLPAATVRWYKDKSTSAISDDKEIIANVTVTTRKTNDDLFSVSSTLRYSSQKEDNGTKIYCTANNSADKLTSARKPQLYVQYSPDGPPIIQNYSNGDTYKIVENNQGFLSCSSKGGNPQATLSWNCFNEGSAAVTVGTTVIKNVTWIASRDLGRACTCQSSHVIVGTQTVAVNIQVLNQTSVSSFYIEGNEGQQIVTINEYDIVHFTCVVDSNPAPSIKIMFGNDTSKEVSHAHTLSFSIENAGCLHAGDYTCEGRNYNGHPSSKTIRLFVRCSPRPLHQSKENVTSDMHVPVTLSFTTLAYPEPGPTGFTWHKEVGTRWRPLLSNVDIQIASSGLQSNLSIRNVSQSDYGQYRVTTVNNIGTYEQFLFLKYIQQHTSTGATTADEAVKGNKKEETDNTAIIVGVTLGLSMFAVLVYATVVTILWRRNTASKETKQKDRATSQTITRIMVFRKYREVLKHRMQKNDYKSFVTRTTYVNSGYKSNVKEKQGCSNTGDIEDSKRGEVESDKQYTSLDPFTKNENTTYDVIQAQ